MKSLRMTKNFPKTGLGPPPRTISRYTPVHLVCCTKLTVTLAHGSSYFYANRFKLTLSIVAMQCCPRANQLAVYFKLKTCF